MPSVRYTGCHGNLRRIDRALSSSVELRASLRRGFVPDRFRLAKCTEHRGTKAPRLVQVSIGSGRAQVIQAGPAPLRIAVAGKGGAGKSVIAGTLARLLAQQGHTVLALDSDLMPGLDISLGARSPAEPPLNAAAERDEHGRWRVRRGVGAFRAVKRYATPAPDGVVLLRCGKVAREGRGPIMGALNAFYKVIHGLRHSSALAHWTVVGDLPAGPRQTAFDWAPLRGHARARSRADVEVGAHCPSHRADRARPTQSSACAPGRQQGRDARRRATHRRHRW